MTTEEKYQILIAAIDQIDNIIDTILPDNEKLGHIQTLIENIIKELNIKQA